MRRLMLLMALLLAGTTGAGANQMIGSGVSSCGTLTANRRSNGAGLPVTIAGQLAQQDMTWVLGFLSGIGFVCRNGNNPLDGVDAQDVWGWVDLFCQAHPVDTIATAAAAFSFAHPHK